MAFVVTTTVNNPALFDDGEIQVAATTGVVNTTSGGVVSATDGSADGLSGGNDDDRTWRRRCGHAGAIR